MFAINKPDEAKRGVKFEEDLAPGADATLTERVMFMYNKSPLADPTNQVLMYNVTLFGAAVFVFVKYGGELAI